MANLLFDIGLIIIVATFLSYAARTLKQPLLVAYVAAGILIGPVGLGLITSYADINILAELGVAFLLFTVGLEIDFQKLRTVGTSVLAGSIIQIAVTFFIGVALAAALGFSGVISIYIGLLLAFSSTMIVAKILVDKDEVKTLHGRIMLGILIIQDILVILAIPMLSNMFAVFSLELMSSILIKGLGLFSFALVLNRFAFKRILDYAAKTQEVLFFTAVTTCFLFMGLAYYLGFSIAIGAFIGGLALANFPYSMEIFGEMHSLRDFFSVMFFTTLGMQLNLWVMYSMFVPFIIILLMILLAKPLILSLTYLLLGYGGRTSSIIGLGLGQASEFSFILAAQGFLLGHLSQNIYSLFLSVVVVSMVLTPYFMMFRNNFYNFFSGMNFPFKKSLVEPKFVKKMEKEPETKLMNHTIIMGCDIMGGKIVNYLTKKQEKIIVAEHNPEIIGDLRKKDIYCLYGDVSNDDILKKLRLYKAKLLIITVPNVEISSFVIKKAKRFNREIKIFARASSNQDSETLYEAGADFVVVPDIISGLEVIRKIGKLLSH